MNATSPAQTTAALLRSIDTGHVSISVDGWIGVANLDGGAVVAGHDWLDVVRVVLDNIEASVSSAVFSVRAHHGSDVWGMFVSLRGGTFNFMEEKQ